MHNNNKGNAMKNYEKRVIYIDNDTKIKIVNCSKL